MFFLAESIMSPPNNPAPNFLRNFIEISTVFSEHKNALFCAIIVSPSAKLNSKICPGKHDENAISI